MKEQMAAFLDEQELNLKGKAYLPVAARIVWFRQNHPDWLIDTSAKTVGDRFYMYCRVMKPIGTEGNMSAVSTAHKEVKFEKGTGASKDYPLETAETGAIGRALGLCGYGTLGGDFNEGDQLADSPVAGATRKKK